MATKQEKIKYYERSLAYLNNEMYDNIAEGGDKKYISKVLFPDITPTYNPIPKLISTMSNLAMSSEVKIIGDVNNFITNICNRNKFNSKKMDWMKKLLLSKEIYIESMMEEKGEVDWTIFTSDMVEIKELSGKLYRVKITGNILKYNESEDEFEDIKVVKTYTLIEDKVKVKVVDGNDNVLQDEFLTTSRIPVAVIKTNYDLTRSMYIVDEINEIEAYKKSIFYHCGEPLLSASGVKELVGDSVEEIATDKFKKQKVLFSGFDTDIKLLEMKGSSTARMLESQAELKADLRSSYPELNITSATHGSNLSTESVRLKLKEVTSKVETERAVFINGIIDLLEISAEMKGETLEGSIELGEVITDDMSKTLNDISLAKSLGLISDPSAMALISPMFLDGSVENEAERLGKIGKAVEMEKGLVTNSELPEHGTKAETPTERTNADQ